MVDPFTANPLRLRDRTADCAGRVGYGFNFAEFDPARRSGRRSDDFKPCAVGQGTAAKRLRARLGFEFQHETRDLRRAHFQNGDGSALQRLGPLASQRAMKSMYVIVTHLFMPFASCRARRTVRLRFRQAGPSCVPDSANRLPKSLSIEFRRYCCDR